MAKRPKKETQEEPLDDALDSPKRGKAIDESEVIELFEDPDADNPQTMYEQLEEMGIDVVSDSGEEGALIIDSDDDVEEAEEETFEDSRVDTIGLADDPVRMYLKEIGQVQLLDPNRETWLSSQMAT